MQAGIELYGRGEVEIHHGHLVTIVRVFHMLQYVALLTTQRHQCYLGLNYLTMKLVSRFNEQWYDRNDK